MILNSKSSGKGSALVFLHGLFGNGRNLYPLSMDLEREHECILLDLRNHGDSGHLDDFSFPLMAEDVNDTLRSLGIGKCALIGHSLGAKAAMEYALTYPERVNGLVCLDLAPRQYKPLYTDFIQSMKSVDLKQIGSRSEAEKILLAAGIKLEEARFLLKNLVRNGPSMRWKINITGLFKNYDKIWEKIEGDRVYDGPALFLRAEHGNFILPEDIYYIKELFPSARLETVKNSGHWLHIDQTEDCLLKIKSFLKSNFI